MMTATTEVTKPVRLRHELKHQISPQEDLVLAGRLRRLFPHDAHAGADGSYRVTSLYFDTPYDLRPRTVVCYDREAFSYPPGNVRVTLDRAVRSNLNPLSFLDAGPFPLKPLEGRTVLEVKYDAFLPDLVRLAVQVPGRQAAACSKYALCRRFD